MRDAFASMSNWGSYQSDPDGTESKKRSRKVKIEETTLTTKTIEAEEEEPADAPRVRRSKAASLLPEDFGG